MSMSSCPNDNALELLYNDALRLFLIEWSTIHSSYVIFYNVESYVMCFHQCQRGIFLAPTDIGIDDTINICKRFKSAIILS